MHLSLPLKIHDVAFLKPRKFMPNIILMSSLSRSDLKMCLPWDGIEVIPVFISSNGCLDLTGRIE